MSKSWKMGADKFARAAKKQIKVKRNHLEWDDEDDNDDYSSSVKRNTEPVESDSPEATSHR